MAIGNTDLAGGGCMKKKSGMGSSKNKYSSNINKLLYV